MLAKPRKKVWHRRKWLSPAAWLDRRAWLPTTIQEVLQDLAGNAVQRPLGACTDVDGTELSSPDQVSHLLAGDLENGGGFIWGEQGHPKWQSVKLRVFSHTLITCKWCCVLTIGDSRFVFLPQPYDAGIISPDCGSILRKQPRRVQQKPQSPNVGVFTHRSLDVPQ